MRAASVIGRDEVKNRGCSASTHAEDGNNSSIEATEFAGGTNVAGTKRDEEVPMSMTMQMTVRRGYDKTLGPRKNSLKSSREGENGDERSLVAARSFA
jgi:hypothetical protein